MSQFEVTIIKGDRVRICNTHIRGTVAVAYLTPAGVLVHIHCDDGQARAEYQHNLEWVND